VENVFPEMGRNDFEKGKSRVIKRCGWGGVVSGSVHDVEVEMMVGVS
jgi:hypothetical protein